MSQQLSNRYPANGAESLGAHLALLTAIRRLSPD